MTDLIFIKEPIVGIFAAAIILLNLAMGVFRRKLPSGVLAISTAVSILLHTVCLTLIFLLGGGYEAALIVVLSSAVITLAFSPRPTAFNDSEVEK